MINTFDLNKPTGDCLTESQIIKIVTGKPEDEREEELEESEIEHNPISITKVRHSLKVIKSYMEENCEIFSDKSFLCFNSLNTDFEKLSLAKVKQTSVNDYFNVK